MFQPPIQSPYDNGWKVMNQPPSVQIKINTTQWDASLTGMSVDTEATNILARYYGELSQFVASCRQARDLGGIHNYTSFRDRPQISVAYYSVNQTELVTVVIAPTNTGSQGKAPSEAGNTFDIKWNFISFPYPGMTQGDGTTIPDKLQYNGVQYIYDPGFSPSGPGATSRYDTPTNTLKSVTPILTPDLNNGLIAALQANPPTTNEMILMAGNGLWALPQPAAPIVPNPPAATETGYLEAYWTKKLGASAILTTPLAGKQYWEVKIVKLPRGRVPASFHVDQPKIAEVDANGATVIHTRWKGNKVTSPIVTFGAGGSDWVWDTKLDTFLTPAIGVCPGYFMPDDLLPGDPTAKPRMFQDYGRLLGMDQGLDIVAGNLYDRARSVYVVATSSDSGDRKTTAYTQGKWYLLATADQTITIDTPVAVYDDFYNTPPPGGQAWEPWTIVWGSGQMVASNGILYQYVGINISQGISFFGHNIIANPNNGPDYLPLTSYSTVNNTFGEHVLIPPDVYGQSLGLVNQTGKASSKGPTQTTGMVYRSGMTSYQMVSRRPTVDGVWTIEIDKWTVGWSGSNHLSTQNGALFNGGDGNSWVIVGKDGEGIFGRYMYNSDSAVQFQGYIKHVPGEYEDPAIIKSYYGDAMYGNPDAGGVSGDGNTIVYNSDGTLASGNSTIVYNSDGTLASGNSTIDAYAETWKKLFSDGYHTPVFVGRVDSCYKYGTYIGDGSDAATFTLNASSWPPLPTHDPSQPISTIPPVVQNNACYTGVDLGVLAEGDTVMIATDADQGYIWFGKNGKWYGKTGMLDPVYDGPAHGTYWAAVMDGFTKSAYPITSPTGAWARATAKPQYFPCVSYRLGPGEVKIVFDTAELKYPPPAGFKVYGQAAAG